MADFFKVLGGVVAAVALVVGVTFGLAALDWQVLKVFAPKQEGVRRETFENSKAYRQGAIQELDAMRFQYEQADKAHQAALRSIILHRAADFTDLPPDLNQFVQQLRRGD